MKKDTFLNYLKSLKVLPRRTEKGFRISYAPRALRIGLVEISPKPPIEEINEAIKWLDKNKLSLPVMDGEMKHLIKG